MVGRGGRSGAPALGVPGSDRPSEPSDRYGRQGGRRRGGQVEPAAAPPGGLRQCAHRGARLWGAGATEAFARARAFAVGDKDAPERLTADYGLWVGSLV